MPRCPLMLGPLMVTLAATTSMVSSAEAAAVCVERVQEIATKEQPAWETYLRRSARLAENDRATLDQEYVAVGRTLPLRAPAGSGLHTPTQAERAAYGSKAVSQLADVVLSYQTPSGGWSKQTDYSAGPRQPGMQWTSQNAPDKSPHYLATFDNHATTSEIRFLAHMAAATGRQDCRLAIQRGIRFMLDAQYPNGGWPQVYPLEGKYHDDVTFNDNVMVDVLALLQVVARGDDGFEFLDQPIRNEAAVAVQKGLDCVLATQVVRGDRKTGWCGQYDALTLTPSAARAYEPAALSGLDTSRVLRWLMTLPDPSDRVSAAIEGGLRWLDEARVTGLTKTMRNGEPMFMEDQTSREVYWARFYDLATDRPIFPGRDGLIYDTFEAMAAKNRITYHYLSDQPTATLTTAAAKWRKKYVQSKEK